MKKLMCLILALVTALSLVACGSSNGGNNTTTDDVKLKVLEGVVDWGETEPYRVLVQKGDPKGLLPGINKAIAELTADNNAKIHEIEEKVASTDTFTPDSVPSDVVAAPETSTSGKLVLVITNEGQAVSRAIDAAVERGSTLVDVTGSYSGLPRRMVMCACSNNEVFKVRTAAHRVDPRALVMICEASEVFGEGFRAPEVGEKTG